MHDAVAIMIQSCAFGYYLDCCCIYVFKGFSWWLFSLKDHFNGYELHYVELWILMYWKKWSVWKTHLLLHVAHWWVTGWQGMWRSDPAEWLIVSLRLSYWFNYSQCFILFLQVQVTKWVKQPPKSSKEVAWSPWQHQQQKICSRPIRLSRRDGKW